MKAPRWCSYWQHALSVGAQWVDHAAIRAAVEAAGAGTAIDGGAHVGCWTRALAPHFRRVVAYEPCGENYVLLAENVSHLPGVELRRAALGATAGEARLSLAPVAGANSGQWAIAPHGHLVFVETIDALGIDDLALLKLDLEGYELPALVGGWETIRRCRPVVVIEDAGWERLHGLPEHGAAAFLTGLGYRAILRSGLDVVYVPEVSARVD